MKKIVIIGGCAAGPKAASKCKRINPENIVELYTLENMVSYSACGMPYFIGGIVPNVNNLLVRSPEEFKKMNIDVFLNHKCTKINPDKKTVVFNNDKEVKYDDLILCIGSNPYIPNIKNYNLKNVFNLKVIQDGIDIKNLATVSKSAVLIGAGYIALELLEAFVRNDIKVTIIEKSSRIIPVFDDEISDEIKREILNNSKGLVEFINNDEVIEFLGNEKFEGVITKNGSKFMPIFALLRQVLSPMLILHAKPELKSV